MASTQNRTRILINFLRDMLLGNITGLPTSGATGSTYFIDKGYKKSQLYRKNAPQVKDPQQRYPCLVFSWDPDIREVTTDIDHGILTIQVYTNSYTDTEDAGNSLGDVLHLLTAIYHDPSTGGTLYLYQAHDMGGPEEPIHNEPTNTWSTACSFKMRVG